MVYRYESAFYEFVLEGAGMMTEIRRSFIFPDLEITSADLVVDVGSGPGWASQAAGNVGADVIAIDLDRHAIEQLIEKMRNTPARSFQGIVSDSERLPLPNGVASVIICTEVLEHVDDPDYVLAELVRIGQPGARYLITVPDPISENILRIVAPSSYWMKPNHLRVFTHEQFKISVRTAGLEIETQRTVNFQGSMWWILNWTAGNNPDYWPGSTALKPPVIADWEKVWKALETAPLGGRIIEALDKLIPKSQTVIARKAASPTVNPSSFGGPILSRSAWKRRLKDGTIRVGGFDVRWTVRRSSALNTCPRSQ
jgi:SAM-dependent methyltransferase